MGQTLLFVAIGVITMLSTAFRPAFRHHDNAFRTSDAAATGTTEFARDTMKAFDFDYDSGLDTTAEIIGWFCKGDSARYRIYDTRWKLRGGDAVMTSSTSILSKITVTDSTRKGYKMTYEIEDLNIDTIGTATKLPEEYLKNVESKFRDAIVGTTVRFETDENGAITKYTNLKELGKQLKSKYNATIDEFTTLPAFDSLAAYGINIGEIFKSIDGKLLGSAYTDKLQYIFSMHGRIFEDTILHEDETKDSYASDTEIQAYTEPGTGKKEVSVDVRTYLPPEAVSSFAKAVLGLAGEFSDKAKEAADSLLEDIQIDSVLALSENTCTINSYLHGEFFANGWPSQIYDQESITLGGKNGKIQQTMIVWEEIYCGYPLRDNEEDETEE